MTLIDPKAIPYELKRFIKNGVVHLETAVTIQDVNRMPHIEAEPIVKGHFFMVTSDTFMCSHCGKTFEVCDGFHISDITWKFCPACGAKIVKR